MVPLLSRLCGCEDDVGQWNANLSVLIATGFDGDVDELEEAVGLLLSEFDLDHAEGASAITTGSATLTAGTHGNGSVTTGGSI